MAKTICVDAMVMCEIGYRHISSSDYMTPICYLPMQRTRMEVAEPCGEEQARDAIMKEFGEGWFKNRYDIRDVECHRI